MPKKNYVTASELGNFLYCKRCWWLELIGVKPKIITQTMQNGTKKHSALADKLYLLDKKRLIAKAILISGVLLLTGLFVLHCLKLL